jgi:hypothetical protein
MQNYTAFKAAMKETWLSDSIENSVFVGSELLDQFTKLTPTGENGDHVSVTVRTPDCPVATPRLGGMARPASTKARTS